MTATDLILADDPAPHIRRLTLNRPDKRNALSNDLRRDLYAALDDADRDSNVRVIILRGAGSCFSAGAGQGSTCTCSGGWSGPTCALPPDSCSTRPSVCGSHGSCDALPGGGFGCACATGHKGQYCEVTDTCSAAPSMRMISPERVISMA